MKEYIFYPVAMSNAFYTGESPESEKIVYLAVTNERETAVREIHSFSDEDIPQFLARCSGDFCVFISDIIDNDDEYCKDCCHHVNDSYKYCREHRVVETCVREDLRTVV